MDDVSLQAKFGSILRAERASADISQEHLAELAGLSRTSVVNIERGRQGVSLGTMYRLAEALGLHPAALLPDVSQDRQESDVPLAIGQGDRDEALVAGLLQRSSKRSQR